MCVFKCALIVNDYILYCSSTVHCITFLLLIRPTRFVALVQRMYERFAWFRVVLAEIRLLVQL